MPFATFLWFACQASDLMTQDQDISVGITRWHNFSQGRMVGASLSFAWLACFAFFLAFFRNEAMKLHEVGSANRSFEMEMSSDCRSNGGGNQKMVDSLSKDLGKSLGYDGMFYKGCLAFLHHNADPKIPMMAQVEANGFPVECNHGPWRAMVTNPN